MGKNSSPEDLDLFPDHARRRASVYSQAAYFPSVKMRLPFPRLIRPHLLRLNCRFFCTSIRAWQLYSGPPSLSGRHSLAKVTSSNPVSFCHFPVRGQNRTRFLCSQDFFPARSGAPHDGSLSNKLYVLVFLRSAVGGFFVNDHTTKGVLQWFFPLLTSGRPSLTCTFFLY